MRGKETDGLVREVARLRGEGLTESIKAVFGEELERRRSQIPLRERIKSIQDEVASWGKTGLVADKAFYDLLNDEDD